MSLSFRVPILELMNRSTERRSQPGQYRRHRAGLCYTAPMSTVAFDTLAYANRLKEAGVPPEQAEAHVAAQADFLTQHILSEVATKDDLRTLKADLKSDMDARFGEVGEQLGEIDARFGEIDARFSKIDVRFEQVDTRLAEIKGEMDTRFAEIKGEMETGFAEIKGEMDTSFAEMETRLTLRMGGMVTALGLFLGMLEFFR